MEYVRNVCSDIQVLRTMWFSKIAGDTHKERLECFYGPQAHACKLCFVICFYGPQAHVCSLYISLSFFGGLGFRTATFALVEILCTYVVQNYFFIYLFILLMVGQGCQVFSVMIDRDNLDQIQQALAC
jgi:hypothetical protein